MHHDFIHNDTFARILCIITIEHSNCYQRIHLMMHLGFWSGIDNKNLPNPNLANECINMRHILYLDKNEIKMKVGSQGQD